VWHEESLLSNFLSWFDKLISKSCSYLNLFGKMDEMTFGVEHMEYDEKKLKKLIDTLNIRIDEMEERGESISIRAESIAKQVELLHETLIAITEAKSLASAKMLAQNVLMLTPKDNLIHYNDKNRALCFVLFLLPLI
jgi:hypothetical protein